MLQRVCIISLQDREGGSVSAYLEDWVIPHGVFGLPAVEYLVLAWELVIGCILARHYPPAPVLLACIDMNHLSMEPGCYSSEPECSLLGHQTARGGNCELHSTHTLASQCDALGSYSRTV